MKLITRPLILLLLVISVSSKAQHSCCMLAQQATNNFADLAGDKLFVAAHESPEVIDYKPTIGNFVFLKCPDNKEARAFEVKSGKQDGRIILLFHEWWGLTDQILEEAEKLHRATGHTVLALDLYDQKVTRNPDSAAKYMQSVEDERARAIISAGIDYVGKSGALQTIGWCFGGGWSLQAALMAGPQCKGCVMYYGMPETDPDRLSKLQAPVLGIFGKRDNWISPQVVKQFEGNMQQAGKVLQVENYDADHAFANPSNPKHDKAASADAFQKAVSFLNANFPAYKPVTPPVKKEQGKE